MFEAGSDVATLTRGQMQDLIGRIFDVKLQQFASEMGLESTPSRSGGGASTEQEDTTRRRHSRSSHTDDAEPRNRRSRRSSPNVDRDRRPQPVPLVELELDEYGYPEGDSLRVLGTIVREFCRLYLPDDAIWSAVSMNQRYQMYRDITKKKFGVYPEPKHNAFLRAHGMKRVFEFMRTGRDFPEVGGPSNAEVGADDTVGADDATDGALF
ncbi:hypothetical protein R1sor_014476 [Riccia sorocarpa]|uniref:Uncharacterized protein n=1 Tax=Riccia sorocarpa TaxID=122646 RepID=A0ABD3HCH9_9MARC